MENAIKRDYQRNPREFDGWLKANAVFGLILAIGMLAMALAGPMSTPNRPTMGSTSTRPATSPAATAGQGRGAASRQRAAR